MDWLERLKYLKSQTSETYKTISEKTGIPKTTIEKIFSGRTKDPKLNMIRSITHCLGFTLDDLIEEEQNSSFNVSDEERQIIVAYRSNPDMRGAVKRLLGITEASIADDITNNLAAAFSENISIR